MAPPPAPERVRFSEFALERLANGRCQARVCLTLGEDREFHGRAEGLSSQAGELRCSAQACVDALAQAVGNAVAFELFGVKAVKAFDSMVVIVSIALQTGEDGHRVVGCCLTDEDVARGAALAVLNATNRILGNRFFMR
ncbi:MAG: alpha-isopropylmalate synthase regulatory domain-containing protein [Gemmatimonadales bacterium]